MGKIAFIFFLILQNKQQEIYNFDTITDKDTFFRRLKGYIIHFHKFSTKTKLNVQIDFHIYNFL